VDYWDADLSGELATANGYGANLCRGAWSCLSIGAGPGTVRDTVTVIILARRQ